MAAAIFPSNKLFGGKRLLNNFGPVLCGLHDPIKVRRSRSNLRLVPVRHKRQRDRRGWCALRVPEEESFGFLLERRKFARDEYKTNTMDSPITVRSLLLESLVKIGVSMETMQEYDPDAEKSNLERCSCFSVLFVFCNRKMRWKPNDRLKFHVGGGEEDEGSVAQSEPVKTSFFCGTLKNLFTVLSRGPYR